MDERLKGYRESTLGESDAQQALGTAVFSGMLGVTAFGLYLTPIFYVVLQSFVRRRELGRDAGAVDGTPSDASSH